MLRTSLATQLLAASASADTLAPQAMEISLRQADANALRRASVDTTHTQSTDGTASTRPNTATSYQGPLP